jgi:hypothetical protein
MKEIRAKKVRCDTPIEKFLSFKKSAVFCIIVLLFREGCCESAFFYADPDSWSKAQNATFCNRINFLFVCLIFIWFNSNTAVCLQ